MTWWTPRSITCKISLPDINPCQRYPLPKSCRQTDKKQTNKIKNSNRCGDNNNNWYNFTKNLLILPFSHNKTTAFHQLLPEDNNKQQLRWGYLTLVRIVKLRKLQATVSCSCVKWDKWTKLAMMQSDLLFATAQHCDRMLFEFLMLTGFPFRLPTIVKGWKCCLSLCLDVNQCGTNRNCCTQRLPYADLQTDSNSNVSLVATICTLCHKKVDHQLMAITLSKPNQFSKFFHHW